MEVYRVGTTIVFGLTGIADIDDVLAILVGSHIVEAHEGIYLGTHSDVRVHLSSALHFGGSIHHLDILAHHAQMPQLTRIGIIHGSPVAPAVQSTIHGYVIIILLGQRITIQVCLTSLLLGVILQTTHNAIVAIGHAVGHQTGHDGLEVILHLCHNLLYLLLGNFSSVIDSEGIFVGRGHVSLEVLPSLGIRILSEASADAEFLGITGQITVIASQQVINGSYESSCLIGLIELQLSAMPSLGIGIGLGASNAQMGSFADTEEVGYHILTLVIITSPGKLQCLHCGPIQTIRTLLHKHHGGLTRITAVTASKHHLVISSGSFWETDLDIMSTTISTMPVRVPECRYIVINEILDMSTLIRITGGTGQLSRSGNQFGGWVKPVHRGVILCSSRESPSHNKHDE